MTEMTEDTTPEVTSDLEPTEPGFYRYSGGRQTMLFLLREPGEWLVILDNGQMDRCVWGYIEQALGVWTLERITGDDDEVRMTQHQVVMELHDIQRSGHFKYFEASNDGEPELRTDGYYMTNEMYEDMGQPDKITVTSEPGDTLN